MSSSCRKLGTSNFSFFSFFQLMEILDDRNTNDIVTWLPHGKAFIIYKKKKFASEVLPAHFKQSKFTSFTRKLNRWGFSRVTRGPETGAYFHKFFQRDDPRLCLQMCCQNIRLQNEALAMHEQSAPFFGLMPQHSAAMNPMNPMTQMAQMNSMNQMAQMNSMNQMAQINAMNQMAQMNTMNQMAQMNPLAGLNNAFLQQQQQQQLLLEQLQQQQAAELVRRALVTQASATQAQLAAYSCVDDCNTNDTMNSYNNPFMDSSLYMELLQQTKTSSLTSQPLMMAIQNSLRTAPISALAHMQQKDSTVGEEAVPIEQPVKSGVRRASAA
jgi:hypothetical protein